LVRPAGRAIVQAGQEPNTPQLALFNVFNEPESEPMPLVDEPDEETVAPTPRRGKRKPLSADLPLSKSPTNCPSTN
jgi:hypothetical protein